MRNALECCILYQQVLELIYPKIEEKISILKPAYETAKQLKPEFKKQLSSEMMGQPEMRAVLHNTQANLIECKRTEREMDELEQSKQAIKKWVEFAFYLDVIKISENTIVVKILSYSSLNLLGAQLTALNLLKPLFLKVL